MITRENCILVPGQLINGGMANILHSEPTSYGIIDENTLILSTPYKQKPHEAWDAAAFISGYTAGIQVGSGKTQSWGTLSKIGVFNNQLVSLSNEFGTIIVACQACDNVSNDFFNITPIDCFNLKCKIGDHLTVKNIKDSEVPVAPAVVILTINTPSSQNPTAVTLALRKLRNMDLFVSDGDIIRVCVNPKFVTLIDAVAIDLYPDVENNQDDDDTTLFFKVKVTTTKYGAVCSKFDRNLTDMIVEGTCNSSIPRSYRPGELLPAAHSIFNLLCIAIHPDSFNSKNSINILLHGPGGTGKKAIVRQCCEMCGIHLNHLDCYSFVQETFDQTMNLLMLQVAITLKCTPCVMHISNIQAIQEAWPGFLNFK